MCGSARADALTLFPAEGGTAAGSNRPTTTDPEKIKATQRRPTKLVATERALVRRYGVSRPPLSRDEMLRALKDEPGLKTLSRSTLDRAMASVWKLPSSNSVK